MARTMSPEDYQELGRRYYKLKQYPKAIEILSQGIEVMPTLELYNHRAASYDKAEDFNAAVKDGREMIKLDKKEVKGYLRTASILEKMEKPETALGLYKYGMKHVPVSDKNFKLLQRLHDKLTRKLSPAAAMDPFTVLPVELAEMILEYLNFRRIVNCMRVSRGWRDFLAKLPKQWLHLDLSGARRPVRRSFVGQAVRRSKERLTRITLHRFEHVDVLVNISKTCQSLAELEIISLPYNCSSAFLGIAKNARNLKKFIIHPEVTADVATELLRHRPDLEHVAYNNLADPGRDNPTWKGPFEGLKTFTIKAVDFRAAPRFSMGGFLAQTPSLQSLTICNMGSLNAVWPSIVSGLPPLRELTLKGVQFGHFPLLPPTLTHLHLDYNTTFNVSSERTHLLRCAVPALTHLHLTAFSGLSGDTMQHFLDSHLDQHAQLIHPLTDNTPLQSITIRGVLRDHSTDTGLFRGLESVFGRSPRVLTPALQTLDIASLPCDDDEIEHLLTYKTGIQAIDVSNTNITGASIKLLADKLPTLRSIKADYCSKINGRDAIEYAERKGVSVSYKMAEQKKGERKIRYG